MATTLFILNGPAYGTEHCYRGIGDDEHVAGCHRSTMDELTEWTLSADKVIVF